MKKFRGGLLIVLLALAVGFYGCAGDDGKDGAPGPAGKDGQDAPVTASVNPESCAVCHNGAGDEHQAVYDSTRDASKLVLAFTNYSSTDNGDGTYTAVATFTITDNGAPYAGTVDSNSNKISGLGTQSWNIVTYNPATQLFDTVYGPGVPAGVEATYVYTLAATATPGTYTMTAVLNGDVTIGDVYGYVARTKIGPAVAGHVQLYDDVSNAAYKIGTWDYSPYVSVESCQKCHGTPYMKHGYRAAVVAGIDDFVACKNCHYDTREGSDADLFFGEGSGVVYTANIMTDTHASHMNEFPYPQSMKNCATCHTGDKLAATLADANFTLAVCESCHADVPADNTYTKVPLAAIVPAGHPVDVKTPNLDCTNCHKATADGGYAPTFAQIHNGYDSKIYTATGVRYSDIFTASIDSATFDAATNTLDFKFSATKDATNGGATALAVADIVPSVEVGLYGYDTKDFLVSPHNKDVDTARNLEGPAVLGDTSCPRLTTVSAADGSWEVKADLSAWADKIADGSVKRLEIAVLPTLKNADGDTVALNAPSRTFDIAANAFADDFYSPIVKVADGCNNCHDALGTTFHSGDRGGNIIVCRLCHTVNNGASHLEMQSRSIDSYVHAIHSMQQFDLEKLTAADFAKYEEEVGFVYPTFTTTDCKSCHNAGTFNVPDQSKSLPGILSASETPGWDRNIGSVPSYVTGPASRACGGCHRAQLINEDNASDLAAFNEHTRTFGYLVENTGDVLSSITQKIMAMFQ